MVRATIDGLDVAAYTVPTDGVESDGTLEWDATTVVVVHVTAAGVRGLGYAYADASAGQVAATILADVVRGRDAFDVAASWDAMVGAVRNIGRAGVAASAISAVDAALWDLKARLLDVAVADLLGRAHERVAVYGSGGFTSYSRERLCQQLSGWVGQGIPRVKMKVGRHPDDDVDRVRAARAAIGPEAELFVDANGAYDRKQALSKAEAFAAEGVTWFEEPVSSDDLEGLRLLRDRAPAGMEITAGEYGYDIFHFRGLLEAGAVDVLQADATRCTGITGFLRAGALCAAHNIPLSAHTAPSLHVHPCCALTPVRHIEYFHDHARIESLLFDGAPPPVDGFLAPDLDRPGLGLELKEADAAAYRR